MKSCSFLLPIIICVLPFVYSCSKQTTESHDLIEADSAFMQGNHTRGDYLLAAYKAQKPSKNGNDDHYYKLVSIEQAYMHDHLSSEYMHDIDNLCDYYKKVDEIKYAKSLFFMGDICYKNEDYPTAVDYIFQAKTIAEKNGDLRLLCLVYRNLGDLYFEQRSLEDCKPYYHQYYNLAEKNKDTLRMAYGAQGIGRIYTYENNIDSTIYYYKKAIELGKHTDIHDSILPYAKYSLCDIYIQIEEYDKALEVLPRDNINDLNWAYWHYGQNHVDSAIYYFSKSLGRYKWGGEIDILRILAQLEEKRGNTDASTYYYKKVISAEDSLKEQQKVEKTIRAEEKYHYNLLKEERDNLQGQNKKKRNWILILSLFGFVSFTSSVVTWKRYKKKQKEALAKQEQLHIELEERIEQSRKLMEQNEERVQTLRLQLLAAQEQRNTAEEERLTREVEVLTSQNQSIEARQRRQQVLKEELYATALYERLKSINPAADKKMSERDWEELRRHIDAIYDGFTARLLRLAKLSETELRVCYLLKINMPPAEIADILYKSKAAITMARQRMLYKLSMRKGRAEEFDEIIGQL